MWNGEKVVQMCEKLRQANQCFFDSSHHSKQFHDMAKADKCTTIYSYLDQFDLW